MFYIRLERHTGFRPAVSLVSSILSIMLGCALIAHPNVGTGIMLIIFPIFIIAHCIARLTHLNIVRYVAGEVLTLISNAVGLILGVILLFDPALSAAALGVILGVDLILLGIEAVVFAIDCYCRLK